MILTANEVKEILKLPTTISDIDIETSIEYAENIVKSILGVYEQEIINEYYDLIPDNNLNLLYFQNIKDLKVYLTNDGINFTEINSMYYSLGKYGIINFYQLNSFIYKNNILYTNEGGFKNRYKIEYKAGYTELNQLQKSILCDIINIDLGDRIKSYGNTLKNDLKSEQVHGKYKIEYNSNIMNSGTKYDKIKEISKQIKIAFN